MNARSTGARIIRLLAASVSFLYPGRFRRIHRSDFADVADHVFAREAEKRPPLRATLAAARVIVSDTFAASPDLWMDAIRDGVPNASIGNSLFRKVTHWLRGGGHDLKLAVRGAAHRPAFSMLVVATLGLGIGASSAAFDALDRAIVRPLPFAGDRQLRLVVMQQATSGYMSVPLNAFASWRRSATTVSAVEVFRRVSAISITSTGADVLRGLAVSGGLPAMLRVRPVIGRALTPADAAPGAPGAVMLTEQYWRQTYGADRSVIGRRLTISNKPMDIVGVWPSGARLDFEEAADIIRTLPAGAEYNSGSWVQVLARIQPGQTKTSVEAELLALTPRPSTGSLNYAPRMIAPADLLLGPQFVTGVWVVFVAALLLLAAAAANAGHLLMERAAMRQQELGIRMALGGSRARLVRLFFAEGLMYAAGGLVLGAVIAAGLEHGIAEYEPRLFRDVVGAGLAGRAFLFASVVAALTAIGATLAPLVRATRTDISAVMGRNGGRATASRSRAMTILVTLQSGLAVLLVFGAVLLSHSLRILLSVDPGIELPRLAEISISLPAARYTTAEVRNAYFQRAKEALTGLPGVRGVITSGMPLLTASLMNGAPYLEGERPPQTPPDATVAVGSVPPNYLAVMGISLLAGRTFADGDSDVALVNELFARAHGGNVLGKRIFLPRSQQSDKGFLVIGVVNNVRYMGLSNDTANQPALYIPAARSDSNFSRFIIRTDGNPADAIDGAKRRLAEIDPTVPVLAPQTGVEVFRSQTAQHRFVALLVGGLAALGFLLAASGVYGAVSLGVVQRTREFGIRMALGAHPARLVSAFVGGGLRPVAVGAVFGAIAAWLAAPYAQVLLFRVGPHDSLSTVAGLAVVFATSALAAWLPSRRISRVDPARTLREA